jgi:hypothetical protein
MESKSIIFFLSHLTHLSRPSSPGTSRTEREGRRTDRNRNHQSIQSWIWCTCRRYIYRRGEFRFRDPPHRWLPPPSASGSGKKGEGWAPRLPGEQSAPSEHLVSMVLLVSTCVFVTQGGVILEVSAPTWTRGKRQLLDTTGKNPVASCPSYLPLALTFSTSIMLSSFFVFVLACFACVLHILPRLSYWLLVWYLLRKLVIVCSSSREEPF